MRVFVTGASGWIGSAVVPALIAAGHEVVGLARSDASAAALTAAGATVRRGELDDLESLRAGAAESDGVIHLAFKHDFSDSAAAGRTERAAHETMLGALEGSDRPFLFASGVAGLTTGGRVATERDLSPAVGPDSPRGGVENLAFSYADRGVRTVALRFAASVHGEGDSGFVSTLATIAREKGISGYIGDGSGRWPAVNRQDAATMVALALQKAPAGAPVHGVGEEGIPTREIAEMIGASLDVPVASISQEDAAAHFGWMARFFGMDAPASSALTQELLGWTPTYPTLAHDLEAGYYFKALAA